MMNIDKAFSNEIQSYRVSPQQRRVWLFSPEVPGLTAQTRMRIEGALDGQRLKAVLEHIVSRHEILRTVFRQRVGMKMPLQCILPNAEVAWSERNLGSPGMDAIQEDLARLSRDEAMHRWNDATETPVRAVLVRLGQGISELLLTVPSVCADNRTLSNIACEIAAAFSGDAGEPEEP